MALWKPAVIIDGMVQNLPAGDTLDAAASEVDVVVLNNASSLAQAIGTPVYISAANAFQPAKADAGATVEVFGLIRDPSVAPSANASVQTDGVLTASTSQWDLITGQTGGLTPGATYFLSPATAGKLTTTAPTASGHYVLRVGRAVNTQTLEISIQPPIKL